MTSEPCSQPHEPEEYVVRIGFHRDSTVCITVEHPDSRTQEEAREVLAMVGELSEVADAIAVTRSGHLVTQRRSES